ETMRIWDHDKILSDVVWVVRKFRPDVIVTRFSPEDQLTHGHHTASAILAREAFSAAGDPNRFPEQLAFVKPWRPTRLVWNTSPFFFSNRNLPFDPTGLTVLEAGGYNSLLGKAYTEIAAASLSMHKSQGVGSPPRRGTRKEYFKLLEGQPMTNSLFEGIDTSWSRVANSESIATEIRQIISQFHPADPAASVPELLKLRFHRMNWLRRICHAGSRRILPIPSRTGYANLEPSALSLWTNKRWSAYPKILPIFRWR